MSYALLEGDVEEVAADFYETYCEAVGGVAFNGDPLPDWDEFSNDPKKTKQANGWRAVAKKHFKLAADWCNERATSTGD